MRVSLSAELPLPGEAPYPPGAVDYYATYSVVWFPGDNDQWGPGDEAIVAQLAEAAKVDTGQEQVLIPAGHAHLVVADTDEDVFEALDAREADLAYLAEVLFADGEVHPELEDRLAGFEQHAVLVNNVAVEPADHRFLILVDIAEPRGAITRIPGLAVPQAEGGQLAVDVGQAEP